MRGRWRRTWQERRPLRRMDPAAAIGRQVPPSPAAEWPKRPRLPSSSLGLSGNGKLDDGIPAVGRIMRPTGFPIFPSSFFSGRNENGGFLPRCVRDTLAGVAWMISEGQRASAPPPTFPSDVVSTSKMWLQRLCLSLGPLRPRKPLGRRPAPPPPNIKQLVAAHVPPHATRCQT